MTSTQTKENVSNILVENWSPLDPAAPILHHLPFKIGHTGHALVSKYLLIKESKSSEESSTNEESKEPITIGSKIKSAAFRGRYIKGCEINLGESYTGVVFREEEGDAITRVQDLFKPNSAESEEYADLKEAVNIRPWTVQNKFKSYTYWTRNPRPSSNDKHVKWIDWLTKIAPSIHCPTDLQKPLKFAVDKVAKPAEPGQQAIADAIDAELPERKGTKRSIPTDRTEEEIPVEPSEAKKAKVAEAQS